MKQSLQQLIDRYQVLHNHLDNVTDDNLIDSICYEMLEVNREIKYLRKYAPVKWS